MENGTICIRCRLEKPWLEFEKLSRNKSGYRGVCKPCRILEAKTNTKTSTPTDRMPDGIILELTLVPHERFWKGFYCLIDMIADDIFKDYKKK